MSRQYASVVTGAGERTANGREAKSEPGTVGMRKGNESERETDGYCEKDTVAVARRQKNAPSWQAPTVAAT